MRLNKGDYNHNEFKDDLIKYIETNCRSKREFAISIGVPVTTIHGYLKRVGLSGELFLTILDGIGEKPEKYVTDQLTLHKLDLLSNALTYNNIQCEEDKDSELTVVLKSQLKWKEIDTTDTVTLKEFGLTKRSVRILERIKNASSLTDDEIINLAINNLKIYLK